jgi:hypothetical protein
MEYCIFETNEEYKARMVINLLEKYKIKTFCKNLGVQNLFGDSKLFTGMDLIIGDVKVYIERKNIGKAKRIINNTLFLQNNIKTIENDEIQKDKYIAQKALLFSITSLFIIPFFFNLEYLIYSFKRKLSVKYILLFMNISYLLFSIISCINDFDYLKYIWKGNILLVIILSIKKSNELNKRKSKLEYLMIIPIILIIVSIFVAELILDIRFFG